MNINKIIKITIGTGLTFLLLIMVSCGGQEPKSAKQVVKAEESSAQSGAEVLMEYLAENGDYVNSRVFPSMIKPSAVLVELGESMHVIDLRSAAVFSKGHIEGAVNVSFSDIPEYFQKAIKPYEYDKIVITCQHGQLSAYTTSLLRLMGYGNVYSMRWGMTSWHPDLAEDNGWDKLVSDKYSNQLELDVNSKPQKGAYPQFEGKDPDSLFLARVEDLFKEGPRKIWVVAEDVFERPDEYFIINYDRRDKYESGHIPGAIRYKPNGTLGIPSEMETLPADKDIVIYCGTGQSSAFATAYLRLLGYKAFSLVYGNNSFMHKRMMEQKDSLSWQAFGPDSMHLFPYVSGSSD